MEIMIKVNTNGFKNGDILVFNNKTKSFETMDMKLAISEALKPFEIEKQKFIDEMKSEKLRFKELADRFQKMTDEMLLRLGGGKSDV